MMHQVVYDTSELLCRLGVEQVIICPGSRNAPLTISLVQNQSLKKISVIDERSAGFVGLGIAQATGNPIVVCCTSGSAVLNFGPACAEAFYQEVPVIFISADRPPEWIDQGDGQTIRQYNVLEPHVKKSYQLPVDLTHSDAQWEYSRKLNEAVNTANSGIKGPVHVNIPFREPFYPTSLEALQFSKDIPITQIVDASPVPSGDQLKDIISDWEQYDKKVIVLGQEIYSPEFLTDLATLSEKQHIPVISDVISNGGTIPNVTTRQDLFLADQGHADALKPDLVVTFGKTLISKNLKVALRKNLDHWTVGNHRPLDTFKNLRKVIPWSPDRFLQAVEPAAPQLEEYKHRWMEADGSTRIALDTSIAEQTFSEFWVFRELMNTLPEDSHVHLSNSMAVRYANFFAPTDKRITFHCNRGTSGIDGPVSTAVGFATASDGPNILITGDLSALYDRNAFLNDLNPNLKIIVTNNGGGGIFDLIPGPKVLSDLDRKRYFETSHGYSFEAMANEIGYDYIEVKDKDTLQLRLNSFLNDKDSGLMEIKTDPEVNGKVYREVKAGLIKNTSN